MFPVVLNLLFIQNIPYKICKEWEKRKKKVRLLMEHLLESSCLSLSDSLTISLS